MTSPLAAQPEIPVATIAPGESRTFSASCPFAGMAYSPEDIQQLQKTTTLLVDYTTAEGKERTQLIYPEIPYPTKTPPSNPPEISSNF
jgi:hypothetical protein